VAYTGESLRPIDLVRIAAGGLPVIALRPQPLANHPTPSWLDEVVFSRTIGVLGQAAWRRLHRLHIGLVGCGRLGSLFAYGLSRIGIRRLTLIDPDRLEPHNLGEMDVVEAADVGRPKAEALASRLSGPGLTAVADSVLSPSGQMALKSADVFICCADHGSARLATGLLAALYLRPLLDVGTGILDGPEGARQGADVRMLLPGRCLLCWGSVADFATARRELREGEASSRAHDWRQQRRGSLRSLNGVAANLGLRLLEEVVAGRRTESAWLRLETDATGLPFLERRGVQPGTGCRACALTGAGDAGVREMHEVI
jgi:hypothetical protein